jgi:hypothetical protein
VKKSAIINTQTRVVRRWWNWQTRTFEGRIRKSEGSSPFLRTTTNTVPNSKESVTVFFIAENNAGMTNESLPWYTKNIMKGTGDLEMINGIIHWCNANSGFLLAVLSFIGLVLSATAIIVSIRTAKLPYMKKLLLSGSIRIDSAGKEAEISAANVGNRAI